MAASVLPELRIDDGLNIIDLSEYVCENNLMGVQHKKRITVGAGPCASPLLGVLGGTPLQSHAMQNSIRFTGGYCGNNQGFS